MLDSKDNGLLQEMDLVEGMATPSFAGVKKVSVLNGIRSEYYESKLRTLPRIVLQLAISGSDQSTKK